MKESDGRDMDSIKILEVGNSFGFDAIAQSYPIFKASGCKSITQTAIHYPACDISRYLQFIKDDSASFWIYRRNSEADWEETYPEKTVPAICEHSWDAVTLMAGIYDLYDMKKLSDDVDRLHDYLCSKTDSVPDFYWINCPPIINEVGNDYIEYEEALYSAGTRFCEKYVLKKSYIKDIIPTGAVIANLRNVEGMREKLTRDTIHTSIPLGRYAQALCFASKILGVLPSTIKYSENGVDENDEKLVKLCADAAITYPFELSKIL